MIEQLTSYAETNIINEIRSHPFPQSYEYDQKFYPRTSSFTSFHPDSLNAKLANGFYSSRKLRLFFRRSIIGDHVHEAAAASINDTSSPRIDIDQMRDKLETYEAQHIPDIDELLHRFHNADHRTEAQHIDNAVENILFEVNQKINLFLQWKAIANPKPLIPADTGIIHSGLQYSGTPDLVVDALGKKMLIDIKCGKEVHEVNKVQLEAYRRALQDCYGIKVDCMKVLLLGSRAIKKKPLSLKNQHTYELCSIRQKKSITEALEQYVRTWHQNFPNPELLASTEFTGQTPNIIANTTAGVKLTV